MHTRQGAVKPERSSPRRGWLDSIAAAVEFISKTPAKLDIDLINQYNSQAGRGVRVVNGTALEKRCCRKATVGSNPGSRSTASN